MPISAYGISLEILILSEICDINGISVSSSNFCLLLGEPSLKGSVILLLVETSTFLSISIWMSLITLTLNQKLSESKANWSLSFKLTLLSLGIIEILLELDDL